MTTTSEAARPPSIGRHGRFSDAGIEDTVRAVDRASRRFRG